MTVSLAHYAMYSAYDTQREYKHLEPYKHLNSLPVISPEAFGMLNASEIAGVDPPDWVQQEIETIKDSVRHVRKRKRKRGPEYLISTITGGSNGYRIERLVG